VLADSARLQEEEADYANTHGFSKHHPAVPLYTEADARAAAELLSPHDFGKPVEIAPGVIVKFNRAGHILGSACVHIELDGEPVRRVFVSGDVGTPDHPVLVPPDPPTEADVMLIESTYGNRRHDERDTVLALLADAITRTAKRGGTVVIPAFAVDRTEIVLLALRQLMQQGRIPTLPVYADSPMALEVLRVYRDAIAQHDDDVRIPPDGRDVFDPGLLHEARTRDESIALNTLHFPSIIVSASGMATGGRVLHHLARLLPDHRNTIVLVDSKQRAHAAACSQIIFRRSKCSAGTFRCGPRSSSRRRSPRTQTLTN
jgi:metallo-beta-lactamase family protein